MNRRVKGCVVKGDGDFFEVVFGFEGHVARGCFGLTLESHRDDPDSSI